MNTPAVFTGEKADSYDENAGFEKGNREWHKLLLEDLLQFLPYTPGGFIDLGCGTGYFAEVFYRRFPQIKGLLTDGSAEMLARAQQKFLPGNPFTEFWVSPFQELDLQRFDGDVDIVFSCLAIHHLSEAEKQILYKKIAHRLSTRGWFILFDLFRLADEESNRLLEHIACCDIQRKLKQLLGWEEEIELEELKLERIKENDRREKKREGDQESLLEDTYRYLREAGFTRVTPVAQENRFICLLAQK
ncbi:MAG: class I SAM-dependent methyltransferase [Dinghuibacter sp.]|nr:class I SAM-dependent methyltransferase [Dinghuibacter sp.]